MNPLKDRKSGANFLHYICRPDLHADIADRTVWIFWTDASLKKVVFFPQLHLDPACTQRAGFVPHRSSDERQEKKWKRTLFPFPTKYKHDSRFHYEGSQHGKRLSVQVREQHTRLSCCSQAERRPLNNKYFSKPV